MRTGLSNLAIGKWIPVAFNQIAPKDSDGKPIITQAINDSDRKLIIDTLMKKCDEKDGLADGMISDPLGCDFDPAELSLQGRKDRLVFGSAKSECDQESDGWTENIGRSPGLSRFSIRCRHRSQWPDPRNTFSRPWHLWTRNDSHGSRYREGSVGRCPAINGLDVHKSDNFFRRMAEN